MNTDLQRIHKIIQNSCRESGIIYTEQKRSPKGAEEMKMKTIETKSGEIFEIWESRKEALKDIVDNIMWFDDTGVWDSDSTLYIAYKDGTCFYVDDCGNREGKFKKTGIVSIIYSNACTTAVYGEYEIYNIDDVDEKYSEENDSEEKFWNVA